MKERAWLPNANTIANRIKDLTDDGQVISSIKLLLREQDYLSDDAQRPMFIGGVDDNLNLSIGLIEKILILRSRDKELKFYETFKY